MIQQTTQEAATKPRQPSVNEVLGLNPDLSRPCLQCRWAQEPSWWRRILEMDDRVMCLHPTVRGTRADAVTGTCTVNEPVSCWEARRFLVGRCAPEGRLFERKEGS